MIYIKDVYATKTGELWDFGLKDLLEEAITNVDTSKVEAVYLGNMLGGVLNGQLNLGAVVAGIMGRNLPVVRVEAACASGGLAINQAWQALKTGLYKNVLVVGAEKMTDHSNTEVTQALAMAADKEESFPALHALVAQQYLNKYSLDASVMDQVAVRAHQKAFSDAKAQFHKKITETDVQQSPMVATPMRLYHCSPISDGAAAVVLSTEESDLELTDSVTLASKEFALKDNFQVVQEAASKLDLTGVKIAEVHDCFSIAEIIALEDLGFAEKGQGWQELTNVKVNVRGGLKAGGHAIGATGVKQIVTLAEAMRQHNYCKGLAHNVGGVGAQVALNLIQKR